MRTSAMYQMRSFVLVFAATIVVMGQSPQAPVVSLRGDSVKIDGQFAHIQGQMPSKGQRWFYQVERKKTSLFVYHFWSINEFKDRKEKDQGFYRAQAWTVEVLDSKEHPEREMIFDRLSDFYFWGNLAYGADQAQLSINAIEGLPVSSYGPVTLKIMK